MTYKHGKADADAPVTWTNAFGSFQCKDTATNGGEVFIIVNDEDHDASEMDDICRAFHLAKLAEEAAKFVDMIGCNTDDGSYHAAQDWLRRYRAAKGEA